MLLVPFSVSATTPENYAAAVTKARAERVDQLKRVDGYLALTASGWLQPGANSVGSAADNRFEVPGAPAHLGTLQLAADGQVSLHLGKPAGSRSTASRRRPSTCCVRKALTASSSRPVWASAAATCT